MSEIDEVEQLLDQCWRLLNKAYEESYGKGYKEPQFKFVLSHQQLMSLRKYAAKLATIGRVYEIKEGIEERLFGHLVIEARRTPYVEAIIGRTTDE